MSASMVLNLTDDSLTQALGGALARAFRGADTGAVVYFEGELGAGKTTCVRSILRTLGVTGPVRSPTYTLIDTYTLAALTCVHIDLYRVQSIPEVEELGLRDLTGAGCLMLIEWPEKGGTAVPPADLNIGLRYLDEGRCASIEPRGELGRRWVSELGRDTSLVPYVSHLT